MVARKSVPFYYRLMVPWVPVEEAYRAELATSEETNRKYLRSYFVNWKPEYEKYGDVQVRMRMSGEFPRHALASALTYQMIHEQPMCCLKAVVSFIVLPLSRLPSATPLGCASRCHSCNPY